MREGQACRADLDAAGQDQVSRVRRREVDKELVPAPRQPPELSSAAWTDRACMVDGWTLQIDPSVSPIVFPRAPLGSLTPRESCPSSQPLRVRLMP